MNKKGYIWIPATFFGALFYGLALLGILCVTIGVAIMKIVIAILGELFVKKE